MPKKAPSAYMLFGASVRGDIPSSLGSSAADTSKAIGELWKNVTPSQKNHWSEQAEAEKNQCGKAQLKWDAEFATLESQKLAEAPDTEAGPSRDERR